MLSYLSIIKIQFQTNAHLEQMVVLGCNRNPCLITKLHILLLIMNSFIKMKIKIKNHNKGFTKLQPSNFSIYNFNLQLG